LPLVAILLVSLALLFTSLLKSTGWLNPVLLRYKSDFENFYKAESAVLLYLQGFPSGYYPELPRVQAEAFGPWEKICAAEVCFVAGSEPYNVSFWDWTNGTSNYRADLEKRILQSAPEKSLYGNKRYFHGEPLMSGVVHQGDLEMDFGDSVRSASFWVEGTALVRGSAHFDTLRLYSLGDVVLQGDVSVGYLELFTQGNFRAEGNSRFRGMVLSSSFQMQDRAQGLFPTVMVALGQGMFNSGASWGEILGKATVSGAAETPGGFLGVEDSVNVRRTILPAFVGGTREIWGRL
jgi:hypothetical protein